MALEHLVLGLIAAGSGHGYAIHRHLAMVLGGRATVQRSHVYAALHGLARGGLVTACEETATGRLHRRVFRITSSGDASLRAWLEREPGDAASFLRRVLPLKIVVRAALAEQPSRREIARERALRRSHLVERTATRKGADAKHAGMLEALLAARARRHLEVELWLLDQLDARRSSPRSEPPEEPALLARRFVLGSAGAGFRRRRPGSASR